jgi:hypothetical protein
MFENPGQRPRRSAGSRFLGCLSSLLLLATLLIGGLFIIVYINPQISFNPFPPPDNGGLGGPTSTIPPVLPPEWTTTPSATPTFTPVPTETPLPPTATSTVPPATLTPTPLPFEVQPGTPLFLENFANAQACNWMGIGGQVFDTNGDPIIGIELELGGELAGQSISERTLSGPVDAYGIGGYEFALSDRPIESENTLWIRLLDPAGNAASAQFLLTTSTECDENLILLNWNQKTSE